MKGFKELALLAAAAVVVAGCGSSDSSSAGSAGGIYGDDVVATAIDFEGEINSGIVAESGQAFFLINDESTIAIGKVSAKRPPAPDEPSDILVPVKGKFDLYEWDEGEGFWILDAEGEVLTDDIEEGDYCNTGEYEPNPEDTMSFLRVGVEFDEDEPFIASKDLCIEAQIDGDTIWGFATSGDVDAYEEYDGDPTGGPYGGEFILIDSIEENGDFEGSLGECDLEGKFSQVKDGFNAFKVSATEDCDGDTMSLKGMAWDGGLDIYIFIYGGDGAIYDVLGFDP